MQYEVGRGRRITIRLVSVREGRVQVIEEVVEWGLRCVWCGWRYEVGRGRRITIRLLSVIKGRVEVIEEIVE